MADTAGYLAAIFLNARDTVINKIRTIAESVQAIVDEDEGNPLTANDRFYYYKAQDSVFEDCISNVFSLAKIRQIQKRGD